jgi:hypothetical protein
MASLNDEGNPFEGYDERMAEAAARQQADEEMYAAHKQWKETTWQGKCVGLVQIVANHFRPFILAVADALQEESSSRAMAHLVRFFIVIAGVVFLYVIANLIQTIIGKEIIIEEEVVIIERVRQSDLDNENGKRDESVPLETKKRKKARSSRDKKRQ